jgi:thymidylate synthase
MEFNFDNLPHHYPSLLRYVVDCGEKTSPRGMETLEVRGLTIVARDPIRRFLAHPHRRPNPVFPIVELMWYLSGDDSPDPITHYIRNTRSYVNPKTGRFDGAYGPRLRRFAGKVDQIKALVERLNADPSSRRAVISLFDPSIDKNESSLDIPCYTLAQFFVRKEKLELYVYARSQDMIRGFVYDTAEWQLLQEIIAGWRGIDPGPFTLFIASAHIYSNDEPLAREVFENDLNFDLYDRARVSRAACSLEEFLRVVETYRTLDAYVRGRSGTQYDHNDLLNSVDQAVRATSNSFWKNAFLAVGAFNAFKFGQEKNGKLLLERIDNELRMALEIWLRHRQIHGPKKSTISV